MCKTSQQAGAGSGLLPFNVINTVSPDQEAIRLGALVRLTLQGESLANEYYH